MFFRKSKKKEAIAGAGIAQGLEKTRKGIFGRIGDLVRGSSKIDEDFLEELEEILISSDVGVKTSMDIVEDLRERILEDKQFNAEEVISSIKKVISKILSEATEKVEVAYGKPHVILVVGVNGTGKTTTIGKLANRYQKDGNKVMLAAGDTFRAAAIEQLEEWASRAGVQIVKHKAQADPAAVVFDALSSATSKEADVLIVDTAGRLHTKSNLMQELEKIQRIVSREIPGAPHEVFLVLDATTGQNGLVQAKEFMKVSGLTGIVLTKLDGTAKGGVVVAITKEMNLPIRYIGVGEGIDDLVDFVPDEFAEGLFAEN